MKRQKQPASGKGRFRCEDAAMLKRFPRLMEALTDPWWDDGKPREVWTLTVAYRDGEVNVGVVDRAAQASSYTTAETLEEALKLIEEALEAEKLPMRPWARQGRGKG